MSTISKLGWPIRPACLDEVALELVEQFEESQWWPSQKMLDFQMRQIDRLLEHFTRSSPVFGSRVSIPSGPMSLERFRTLPVLTRSTIQELGEDLFAEPPDDHGSLLTASSSGSTGQPVVIRKTDVTEAFHQALNLRAHLWHDHDFSDDLASIRAFKAGVAMAPLGERRSRWAPAYSTGDLLLLNSAHCSVGDQLHWLQRERPAYILSYPTNLKALALRCRSDGVELPWLKSMITYSEALTPSTRAIIEEVFQVRVENIFSAAEASIITIQCPEYPENQHVQSENLIVEVVDDHGRPSRPGQIGRVVVTDLHNFATPIIRYEIGDLAEFGPPCPCGRGLPVLQRIYGRVRNMLRLRSGELVFPDIAALKLHDIQPIQQYQMVQRSFDDIDIKIVGRRPLNSVEESHMRRLILEALGQPLNLDIVYVDEIFRHPSGKFEDFMSEVQS